MTDLEERINEATDEMIRAGLSGDMDTARKWSKEMTFLVGLRSPERVREMEEKMGLTDA